MSEALGGLRIALAIAFTALVMAAAVSFAARNSAGTMAPANGPYISGTTINSVAVNARFSDIEAEITDSLSRSGKGGMLSVLRGADGTVAAPAFSFTSELGSGIYKIGASDLGLAVNGVKTHEWTATTETVTGILSTVAPGSANAVIFAPMQPSLATGNFTQMSIGTAQGVNTAAYITYTSNATPALSTACFGVGGSSNALCTDGNNTSTVSGPLAVTGASTLTGALAANGGAKIGSSGTSISGSFRGTAAFSPGTIGANACGTTSVTVTGAVQGSECIVGLPGGAGTLMTACEITATNTCVVAYCNTTGVGITPTTGNVACRAFNP